VRLDLDAVFFAAPDCEPLLSVEAFRPVPLDEDPFEVALLVRFEGAKSVAAMSSDLRRDSPPWGASLLPPSSSALSLFAGGPSCDSGKKTSVGRADGVSVCVSGIRA